MIKKIIIIVIICGLFCGCHFIREHREASSISFKDILLQHSDSGVFEGTYSGGIYGWRENRVRVVVDSGRIKEISLLYSKELKENDSTFINLVSEVIKMQSLNVDAFSGATLTCKAHLKSVENALESVHHERLNSNE